MPVVGISVYLLIAIFFAVHAVRSGRNLIWLFVLFSFPLLGSLVYFVVEYLPELKMRNPAQRVAGRAVGLLDPERSVREAREAYSLVPSAQNQLRLANSLLERGETREAVAHFQTCLRGPAGADPEIRYATALALLRDGQASAALELARQLRESAPTFHPERIALVIAQALSECGGSDAARAEFDDALQRFGSTEVKARFAIFAAHSGDLALAKRLAAELEQAQKFWPRHTKELNRELLRELAQALGAARASA
jgi:hypothetical protein